MPEQVNKKLLVWGKDGIQPEAIEQAERTASLPFIHGHVALMPDAHWGMGATIGSVIPTTGAIIPAAVGVDIGCGMIAAETSLNASQLPDDLGPLLSLIEEGIPAGVGQGFTEEGDRFAAVARLKHKPHTDIALNNRLMTKAVDQMGTLGSGNHFVEVCLDGEDGVWIVLHSGSRGIGNLLAREHIQTAKGLMKRYFIDLPDPDLAYLVEGTPEFNAYLKDLMWAQEYALANRETMMNAVIDAMRTAGVAPFSEFGRINCHHNYTAKEHHFGKDVWVSRKGAIRAREDDYGVIPGSMGTNSFIVRGLGNRAGLESSAHGAGRRMSRKKAKTTLTTESLDSMMEGQAWLDDKKVALLDEHPDAYKDIDEVMRSQADLVTVVSEVHSVLNYKGA